MTKRDLRNGMFGVETDGEVFVVVGDKLIYEHGRYSDFDDMDDNMVFDEENSVIEIHEATCFKQVKEGNSKLIWKRPEVKGEEVKTEEAKVTITEDEFFEVVKKANELFMAIGNEKTPDDGIMTAMMGLQNIAFGALISNVLFDKETK